MTSETLKRSLLSVLVTLALVAPAVPAHAQSEIRILLMGNSLLRGMKRPLLAMLDRVGVEAKVTALLPGTWSLEDHAGSARTESRIMGRAWDIVIMHDKAVGIDEENYPAIRTLNDKILASAASFGGQTQVVLAMTWRDRGVGPERYDTLHGTPTGLYGYIPIAFELDVPVAPIGWAIRNGLVEMSLPTDMWKGGKGRHLSKYGSHLAASVVYAVLRKETPVGAYAKPQYDPALILYVQQLADSTVFGDPTEWNLDVGP